MKLFNMMHQSLLVAEFASRTALKTPPPPFAVLLIHVPGPSLARRVQLRRVGASTNHAGVRTQIISKMLTGDSQQESISCSRGILRVGEITYRQMAVSRIRRGKVP